VIQSFTRPYPSRYGAPVVDRVDTAIFARRYFMNCMQCDYCHDSCCQYGADVDVENVARVEAHAEGLEQYTGVPRTRWWTREWQNDREFPGGQQTRTAVEDGACVFRSRLGRGCMLHSYALEKGLDYHELKPMGVCFTPRPRFTTAPCSASTTGRRSTRGFGAKSSGTLAGPWWSSSTRSRRDWTRAYLREGALPSRVRPPIPLRSKFYPWRA
jgi:hypothetical protein